MRTNNCCQDYSRNLTMKMKENNSLGRQLRVRSTYDLKISHLVISRWPFYILLNMNDNNWGTFSNVSCQRSVPIKRLKLGKNRIPWCWLDIISLCSIVKRMTSHTDILNFNLWSSRNVSIHLTCIKHSEYYLLRYPTWDKWQIVLWLEMC